MPRPRSFSRQSLDHAQRVLEWVDEALSNPAKHMGLFPGGLLHDEVKKAKILMQAYNRKIEARASRGRY